MAYDDRFSDRNRPRGRWREDEQARREWRERETQWQGDDSFGSGWGNQTARPARYQSGGLYGGFGPGWSESPIDAGGPGWSPDYSGTRFDRADVGGAGSHRAPSVASVSSPAYGFGAVARLRDPLYSEWREREIAALDRDYEEYRREHQAKFDREFDAWRERRGRQREAIGRIREDMEVIGADGAHVGAVDKIRGEHIVLNRKDPDAGGVHHAIPCGWIDSVDDKVKLNLTAEEAKERWRIEGRSRALFEREDSGSIGPRTLNRSFAGTYPEERER